MQFEWDEPKAKSNRAKHGISFEETETMFGPENPVIFDDLRHSEDEDRYIAIGFSNKGRLLTVSFTRRGPELIRIISARKASREEAELYAKYKRQEL
jgi:uncharacterized protein